MFDVAILGASGYTGAELIRLLAGHPSMRIAALSANAKAGQPIGRVFPHLDHLDLPELVKIEAIDLSALDLVFCALPHRTSQSVIKDFPRDLKVVDLSADFRLRDPAAYEAWYGTPHLAPEVQPEAVYGLTEVYRDAIRKARLVAGTGCNAMTGLFMLRPLVAAGVVDRDDIILDLKCGPTGAGRSATERLLYAELAEGASAYGYGGTHRHLGEFDQELSLAAGRDVRIRFTPHLVPMNRGILATAYVKGEVTAVRGALEDAYAGERFVHVLPEGLPTTMSVRGSNLCKIGVAADRVPGRVLVVGALDNLAKGSSGQAIQNANLMLGLPEEAGLEVVPVFP